MVSRALMGDGHWAWEKGGWSQLTGSGKFQVSQRDKHSSRLDHQLVVGASVWLLGKTGRIGEGPALSRSCC